MSEIMEQGNLAIEKSGANSNGWEKKIANYDRAQRRNKQNRFERSKVICLTDLGFENTDDVTVAVLDRLSGKVGTYRSRPNLFDEDAE